MEECNNNVAIANSGGLTNGTITGGLVAPVPNVCPGCGRCRDCGRPYPDSTPYQSPFWPPYQPQPNITPQPYWGSPQITCGGTAQTAQPGTVAINATAEYHASAVPAVLPPNSGSVLRVTNSDGL